jgi:putative ABC transport system permease protein
MALIVLLNLDVMFVSEKKRELIVLMINGFSTKDAKAYIYRDSIVLTVIGILLGIVLGSFMGGITVAALEPDLAYYHKGFNEIAALIGAVGAGTFAVAVLLYALRMIPRFNLTDINRF